MPSETAGTLHQGGSAVWCSVPAEWLCNLGTAAPRPRSGQSGARGAACTGHGDSVERKALAEPARCLRCG